MSCTLCPASSALILNVMGWFSEFLQWLGLTRREVGVLVIGLDNAGKTTVVRALQRELGKEPLPAGSVDALEVSPTLGYSEDTVLTTHLRVKMVDMAGQVAYRDLWKYYFDPKQTHGIIFVVDTADKKRLGETAQAFGSLLETSELAEVPILVLCNKCDLVSSVSRTEVLRQLGVSKMMKRSTLAVATDAKGNPKSVLVGFDWLCFAIRERGWV